MNLANIITLSRIFLALLVFALLLHSQLYVLAFVLTILVIVGDFADGQVARRFKLESRFGAWLDIAGDRIVEIGYWIVFASLGWISAWVAIVFILRGIFVDGMRSFAQAEGFTAFGKESMMKKSTLSYFIVASPFSRFAYAVVKVLAFCIVILAAKFPPLKLTADILVYFATFYCIARGVPVLLEGRKFFQS